MKNIHLKKYTIEEKRRYKLYKRKKTWVVAGITMFSSALLMQMPALADETTTLTLGETTSIHATPEAKPPEAESETSEPVETPVESAQTQVQATPAPEAEVTPQTSTDTATEADTSQTEPQTDTQADAPVEQPATSGFRKVAAESTVAQANATEDRSIHVNTVTADNSGKLSSQTAADGSTEYTFTTDNTRSSAGKVGMTFEYTGQNGDTFSMIVKPNAAKGGELGLADNLDATGSPQKTALGDGSYKYTWTITGGAANTNVTVKQTVKSINIFTEELRNSADAYQPYLNSSLNNDLLVSGDNYQISFLINDVPAPTSSNVKIILEKRLNVTGAKVETKADAYVTDGKTNVTVDTNYVYEVTTINEALLAGTIPAVRGLATVQVPVPENFILDENETSKYLMHTSDPFLNGNLKVSQPGGAGTPIIMTTTSPIVFTDNSAKLSFIGRYTSTQTSGQSEAPSGWVDLGDGKKHYFGAVNIDTGEALDPSAISPEAQGFAQKVLPKEDPTVHENYGVIIHYSNSEQSNNVDVTLVSDYNSLKTGSGKSEGDIDPVKRPILANGDSSAPVLYAVGLTANGLTEFTPTYHFEFPEEITTTGITLPLNNVTDDHADFKSYNPAQSGYTVVVTGSDGTKITQRLQAGENYDPLTGQIDHFGEFRTGKKLAAGVRIVAYDVTPDAKYYANAYQNSINGTTSREALNDINSGLINILGYLNSKAQLGQTYKSKIQIESENKRLTTNFQVEVSEPLKLPIQGYGGPESAVGSGKPTTYIPGETFTLGLETLGTVSKSGTGKNLDAGGVLTGKGNKTTTDLPGHALAVEYGTIKEPILYLTLPDQTTLTNFKNSDQFYQVTFDKNDKNQVAPQPKITQKQNADGKTVVVLDWTGTGFELKPKMRVLFNLQVVSDAVNGFDTGLSKQDLYVYKENGKNSDLYTADQLKKLGVSTEGLQVYKANVNNVNNTSWIQLGGDTSNTELAPRLKTQITFDDGSVAQTTLVNDPNNRIYFKIVATEEIKPAPLIRGTGNYALSEKGLNYPAKDYLTKDGQLKGLQTLQMGMVNNLATPLQNMISVMNLPQAGITDGNIPSAVQEFTLNLSAAGELAKDTTNNHLHDAHTLYYSTKAAVLSTDGTTLTFEDGTTWKSGQPVPSELLTADQVTDWSTIKALVMDIPTLSMGNKIIYHFQAYSPTSETNMGKKVSLRQVGGYTGQKALVIGTITDAYGTYATIKHVDQNGNLINGYPDLVGKATLNETTGEYELENNYLLGASGQALKLPTPPTITGYKFVENQYSSTVFKADGSTVITRVYQVDQARLFEDSLKGKLLDQATGDPQANNGSQTPTGVSEIQFAVTDAQLKKPGYTYKITVVDQNGTLLSNKEYASLAEALDVWGVFDDKTDGQVATQNFIVKYTADFQKAVVISTNDPQKQIPETVEKASTTTPYFNDGQTAGLMFYDQTGAPVLSDTLFERAGYRYTVVAPDGKTYANMAEALAAKLTFDNTDNLGNTDQAIQVYQVNYVEDIQALRITIIDDTTKTELRTNELLGQGLAGAKISDQTLNDYQALIKQYLDQGYELVESVELPTNYDNDPAKDQLVTVHLTHGTKTQAGASKVVTETITYVYGNGPKKGQTAAETVTKDYTFTSVDTIDKVTGAVLTTVWSDGQTTTPVTSPSITGYTPDIAEVSGQAITHESAPLTTVVTYTAGEQTVKVHYIDVYGTESDLTAGKEITAQTQTITGEAGANYTNTLWDHATAGYELVQAQPEASAGTFDEDPDTEQNYYVYLTHRMEQVQGTPVTVGQTINYIYKTGPKAGQIASPSQQSSHTFVPTHTVDQVTKQNVGEPTWAPATAEFSAVTSPTIAGYTADKAVVEALTVDPSSTDSTVTVYYDANEQRLTYTVIDDTTGEVLVDKQLLATGASESAVETAVADKYRDVIEAYKAQGYVLVSSESLPANFDANDAVDQNVVVHLTHDTKQATGQAKTVTQTIEYIYGNGPKKGQTAAETVTKDYIFTSVDTIDTVTGAVLTTVWSDGQTTTPVTSPSITGYTPDIAEVSGQAITHDSAPLTTVVTYTAGEQTVKVHYIDVYGTESDLTAGKEITAQTQTITGEAGANYTNTLWDHAAAGYELVQAQPEASAGTFDEDPDTEQNYYVYLTHRMEQVQGTPVTVGQTINYVYKTGPKAGQIASPSQQSSHTFVPTHTVDQVTKQNVGEPIWAPATAEFSAVTSPTIAGYTADKAVIEALTVDPSSTDSTVTVYYDANEQRLTYTVIDDTTGEVLVEQQLLATGVSESAVETAVAEKYQVAIQNYVAKGYVLVSAAELPATFDNNDVVDQNVVVHLKHGTKQTAGANKTVTQLVNYVYGNGPKAGQNAAPAYQREYVFTSVDTIDTVTGAVLTTVWSDGQTTTPVTSPSIAGYTPDIAEISGQAITHESAPLTTVVTYTAGEQTVKVHYIDVYGTESDLTAGKEITAQTQTITGEAGANYTNTLWDHAAAGYELVQAQPEASAGTFDEDPDTEQNYYVYLTHRMEQVQGTSVTVGQTINYVYKTGPKAGQIASPSQQSSHTFVPTHTVDQVTKQNVGEPTWAPATAEFSAVTSPTITGYTADKAVVEALTVDPSSADSTVTVYYDANEQRLTYTVIDDTTGEVLVDKQLLASGDSTSVIPTAVTDKYRDIIEAYQAQGYVLVSSESLPANFDADDAVDQNVTLHLAHGTKQVAGKSKTVTQTINYLYGNGPKQGQTAAAQVHKDYSFTSVDTVDAVTGEILTTVWSPAQLTDAVVSPVITGYIFDKATIASQEVTADSTGLEDTVIYMAGEQLVKVHYIDVYGTESDLTAGKELTDHGQNLTGAAGSTYTNNLWDYAQAGYKLVQAQPEASAGTFDEDPEAEQNYYVYLTHDTKQVAGPTKTVTQTVEYIYGNGPKQGQSAAETVTKDYNFTAVDTIDIVTGEVIQTTWSASQMTATVPSPKVAGYIPDVAEVSGQNITHASAPLTTVVTYTAGEQHVKVHYVDVHGTETDLSAGQELTAQMQTFAGAAGSTYTNTLWDYAQAGYKLVQAQPEASAGTFDEDPGVEQNYYVYLTHNTKQVAGQTKTVTQTVEYIYGNGPKQGQPAAQAVVQTYNFTATETLDAVTGEVLATAWSPAQMTTAITSPQIAGYSADRDAVASQNITHMTPDQTLIVSYTADPQVVKVHYIDVYGDQERELLAQTQTLTGTTGGSYDNVLWNYAQAGYELVKAQPEASAGVFDADRETDQHYYVYLTHKMQQVTGVPVIVTDTINYIYGNGPKQGQPVSPAVVVTKTFVPLYTVDAVTGDIVETTWSGDGVIEASQVPEIAGYTPDKTMIAERILTPTMENQSQTVYYMLNEEPAVDETPEPEMPTETVDEEPGIVPDEKQEEQNVPPKQAVTTQTTVAKEKTAPVKESQTVTELPQTGDAATEKTTFVGAMLATLAGLLGFATTKRKKEDK